MFQIIAFLKLLLKVIKGNEEQSYLIMYMKLTLTRAV